MRLRSKRCAPAALIVPSVFRVFAASHASLSPARHIWLDCQAVIVAQLLYTAQRRGDAIRMGAQHVRGGTLYVKQEKTSAELAIPMHPDLAAELPQP